MKKILSAILVISVLACLQMPAVAAGSAAPDITKHCQFEPSTNASSFKKAHDGNLLSIWTGKEGSGQTIDIIVDGDYAAGGLYFRWNAAPQAWTLYALDDSGEQAVVSGGGNGCLSDYEAIPYAFSSCRRFELRAEGDGKLSIAELSVYGTGDRPSFAPHWREFAGRVDVMVVSAHPDDDQLYLGGVIPTYTNRGKTSITVFMTYGKPDRRFEAMEGVWTAGGRYYPVMSQLRDKLTMTIEDARKYWPEAEAAAYLAEQIRKYKPSVIVTHGTAGEYGHGAHKLTSALIKEAFERCGDADYYPKSAEKYGVWNAVKLYLHAENENKLKLDTSAPLLLYGGRTAFEVAKAGYDRHKSQHQFKGLAVRDTINDFGLAATRVGKDEGHDDMFEHVTREAVAGLNPQHVDKSALTLAVRSAQSLMETGAGRMRLEAAGLQAELGRAEAVLGDASAGQGDVDAETAAVYAEMTRIAEAAQNWK